MLFWNVGDASPDATVGRGARLLNLFFRDLMCMSAVMLFVELLSAVDLLIAYRLACGFVVVGMFLVVLIPISVLDLLYGN